MYLLDSDHLLCSIFLHHSAVSPDHENIILPQVCPTNHIYVIICYCQTIYVNLKTLMSEKIEQLSTEHTKDLSALSTS